MQWQSKVPDIMTYTSLIGVCKHGKQPKLSLQLFKLLQWQGVVPNIITYSALISVCKQDKQPERALELFKTM